MLCYLTQYCYFFLFLFHHRVKRHFPFSNFSVGVKNTAWWLWRLKVSCFSQNVYSLGGINFLLSAASRSSPVQHSGLIPLPISSPSLLPRVFSAIWAITACCNGGWCGGRHFWENELKLQAHLAAQSMQNRQRASAAVGPENSDLGPGREPA